MAKFEFDFPSDLMNQLQRAGNIDNIAKKMISAAIPVLERNVKKECAAHRRTGSMVNSVKATKVEKYKNGSGYYAVVRPTGKDENGVRNMEKMAHAEYGTSHQAATPILSKAVAESEEEVTEIMQRVYNLEVLK